MSKKISGQVCPLFTVGQKYTRVVSGPISKGTPEGPKT